MLYWFYVHIDCKTLETNLLKTNKPISYWSFYHITSKNRHLAQWCNGKGSHWIRSNTWWDWWLSKSWTDVWPDFDNPQYFCPTENWRKKVKIRKKWNFYSLPVRLLELRPPGVGHRPPWQSWSSRSSSWTSGILKVTRNTNQLPSHQFLFTSAAESGIGLQYLRHKKILEEMVKTQQFYSI